MAKSSIIKEFFEFLWKEKMWWIIPIVVILLGFGLLVIMAQGSAVAPFIYTLF
jgi:uncharacterized membrane protein